MSRLLFLVLLMIAFVRIITSISSPFDGKKLKISGMVISEPREYGDSLLVNLRGFTFFVPYSPDITFHSTLTVLGIARGRMLDKVSVISITPANSFLFKIRSKILSNIKKAIPEPEGSLVSGIILGQPNIPVNFKNKLVSKGLSHIVVASGGNLVILAGYLESLLSKRLKRKVFLPVIFVILVIYSYLTGLGAPIVRALIMWSVIMLAQLLGRVVSSFKVLLFTALLMLCVTPTLVIDVSFWLSVGSTFGILLLGGFFQKKFARIPFISESLAISISAQLGVLPVSVFIFHEVNIWSPFWNTLVLWTVPYITMIGMIGSLAAIIFEPLAKLLYLLSYPFAWYFVHVVGIG